MGGHSPRSYPGALSHLGAMAADPDPPELSFGPYRLEGRQGLLRRGDRVIALPPKATAVLWCLALQAGGLVTKADLLDAVWGETSVTEGVLTAAIRDLRRALDDDADRPRYIETVHRRGYRFVATVTPGSPRASARRHAVPVAPSPAAALATPASLLVGREGELARLLRAFEGVQAGRRQIVFVTGEAGIGKTALVDALASELERDGRAWLAAGQCVEQYGAGEAYLPIFDVLRSLCRGAGRDTALAGLARHAPGWLAELSGVLDTAERARLADLARGAAWDRMLRELADLVEALAAVRPLVWVLEDLHWSDPSTVEALAMLARRRDEARFMLVGTLRPVDLIVRGHVLGGVKQELLVHGQCGEISLSYLPREAIGAYVERRLPAETPREAATAFLYRRTLGLPLFMVSLATYLADQGMLESLDDASAERLSMLESQVPDGVQQFIEAQLSRLHPAERRALEGASVAGLEFAVAEPAAALPASQADIEAACDGLARRGAFVADAGVITWPDGTVSGRYRFGHAIYRQVLYRALGSGQRARLHLAIGMRLEAAYASDTSDIAAELAMHFEEARHHARAAHYHHQAAQRALRQHGYGVAADHASRGLALLADLPPSPEHAHKELLLCLDRATALTETVGYGAAEVEATLLRARALRRDVTDTPAVIHVLGGLWNFYLARAAFERGRELAAELLEVAAPSEDPGLALYAHNVAGQTKHFSGDLLGAQPHIDGALVLIAEVEQRRAGLRYGVDHDLVPRGYGSQNRWLCGHADQARRDIEDGIERAERRGVPFFTARMRWRAICVRQSCGEVDRVEDEAGALVRYCRAEGVSLWGAGAGILHGWARGMRGDEAIAEMRTALDAWQATGMLLLRPYYLALLAEVCRTGGHLEAGRAALAEALAAVQSTGERWYEAEIHRGLGELAIAAGGPAGEAETCFRRAADVAGRQGALALELRAAMSLVRLARGDGRLAGARQRLAEVYSRFSEGFDTGDLRAARVLMGTTVT
jgi:DNA-binding winged helix-turn-helix (wHTH) protein